MGKKNELTLSRVIAELSSAKVVHPGLNPDYFEHVRKEALRHLAAYQDAIDAGGASEMGVAEVGAIIRRQREHIAFVEGELKAEKAALGKAHTRLNELEGELKRMGAL